MSPTNKTKHHRKPVSLGGQTIPRNISLVPKYKHRAWHVLFDNFPVLKILVVFQEYAEVFVRDGKSEFQIRRDKEWVSAKPARIAKKRAWDCLFRNLTLQQIIEEINKVWIDPDYELVIVPSTCTRITLGLRVG